MVPRNLLVAHTPLVVRMQVDLRVHLRNAAEVTKAIGHLALSQEREGLGQRERLEQSVGLNKFDM